jgi:NADPH-dependent curcumin reductase CurA
MARETISYRLAQRPKGEIVPGETFRQEKTPAPTADDLKDGQVLIEALYLSLDPAMRGWLNGKSLKTASSHQLAVFPHWLPGRESRLEVLNHICLVYYAYTDTG